MAEQLLVKICPTCQLPFEYNRESYRVVHVQNNKRTDTVYCSRTCGLCEQLRLEEC